MIDDIGILRPLRNKARRLVTAKLENEAGSLERSEGEDVGMALHIHRRYYHGTILILE